MAECKEKRAGFYIWETKPITFALTRCGEPAEGALDDYKDIIVTISQAIGNVTVEKTGADLDVDPVAVTVGAYLTQDETGKFSVGEALVQMNILYEDSERDVTCQRAIEVWDNLHRRAME